MNKIAHAKRLIVEADKPVIMSSFGKDSMVLLHLAREVRPHLPVISHRHPWFPFKNEFADSVIRSWNLTVHDYPPIASGIKYDDKHLELVARYPFGDQGIDLPINTLEPIPRRQFVCGLQEWIWRPTVPGVETPWKTVIIGHKSSDEDPMEGPVPLKRDTTYAAGMTIVFPLRHWDDNDIWNYTEEHNIPYDKRRYENRKEVDDKWLNPDYLHACTACIDPRKEELAVLCPRSGELVHKRQVMRLQSRPDYIEAKQERKTQNANIEALV